MPPHNLYMAPGYCFTIPAEHERFFSSKVSQLYERAIKDQAVFRLVTPNQGLVAAVINYEKPIIEYNQGRIDDLSNLLRVQFDLLQDQERIQSGFLFLLPEDKGHQFINSAIVRACVERELHLRVYTFKPTSQLYHPPLN